MGRNSEDLSRLMPPPTTRRKRKAPGREGKKMRVVTGWTSPTRVDIEKERGGGGKGRREIRSPGDGQKKKEGKSILGGALHRPSVGEVETQQSVPTGCHWSKPRKKFRGIKLHR